MKNIIAWLVILAGIIMLLPLLSITQLGVAASWILAIDIIVIGVLLLSKKK
jgi:hypothetical protein